MDKYGEEFVKIIYTIDEVEHIYTQKQLYEFYWKQKKREKKKK